MPPVRQRIRTHPFRCPSTDALRELLLLSRSAFSCCGGERNDTSSIVLTCLHRFDIVCLSSAFLLLFESPTISFLFFLLRRPTHYETLMAGLPSRVRNRYSVAVSRMNARVSPCPAGSACRCFSFGSVSKSGCRSATDGVSLCQACPLFMRTFLLSQAGLAPMPLRRYGGQFRAGEDVINVMDYGGEATSVPRCINLHIASSSRYQIFMDMY